MTVTRRNGCGSWRTRPPGTSAATTNTAAKFPAGQRETEADSVAFVVLAALGMDISSSTVEYVADWSRGDTDVLRAAVETVHRVAAAVLADLDQTDPRETAA